jgi:hypothetical protein
MGYDKGGKCDCSIVGLRCRKHKYQCWNYAEESVECSLNPSCPEGMVLVEKKECGTSCESDCSVAGTFKSCLGNNLVTSICDGGSGCLKWSNSSVACDSGFVCQNGACVVKGNVSGKLSLGFSNVRYQWNAPYHYYYHDRTFVESGGVGVTLTWGKVCGQNGGCNSKAVDYRIEANDKLVLNNNYFNTIGASETFTLTYAGTDDNGNSVSVSEVVKVSGSSWISP